MRTTKLITISLPPELFRKVEQLAKEEDRSRSGILREAFKRYIEDRERRLEPTQPSHKSITKTI